jgi:hypothetical protein
MSTLCSVKTRMCSAGLARLRASTCGSDEALLRPSKKLQAPEQLIKVVKEVSAPGIQQAHPAGMRSLAHSSDGICAALRCLLMQRSGRSRSSQDVHDGILDAGSMPQARRAHYQDRLQDL